MTTQLPPTGETCARVGREPVRYLSVFSGAGMHDLGFERAGWQCVGQIEWEEYCQAVLEKHWPGLPRWKDVRDVSVAAVRELCGRVDLVTGGFACQDVSIAGRGAGLGKTTRSGLTWRNLFRLIRGLRPDWIVIENVPALRTRGYDRARRALARTGYSVRPFVVGARHLGARHKRPRVWMVGNASCVDRHGKANAAARSNPFADAKVQAQAPATSRTTDRDPHQWPAWREMSRHGFELPLVRELPRGSDARGIAGRLVRFEHVSALKSIGNGNPPQCAELIARSINRVIEHLS